MGAVSFLFAPKKRRQYIILRKIHNLTKEEVAEKMGIAPDTVNNEVYRSFLKLKEKVETMKAAAYADHA